MIEVTSDLITPDVVAQLNSLAMESIKGASRKRRKTRRASRRTRLR